MKPVDVVINADDLGSTPEVNNSIFELVDRRQVLSVTLIANSPYIEEACKRVSQFPYCSFGVHLNLTEYEPLTDTDKLRPLLDQRGSFSGNGIREVPIEATLTKGIFEEFCAQIDKLHALGVKVSHIDSHHHVHSIPRVFPVLKRVQKQYQIRKVRISRNIYGPNEDTPWRLRMMKSAYNFLLRHYYRTVTTGGFTDFNTFYELGKTNKPKHQSIELMVHPGSRAFDYEDETEILSGPWRDDLSFPVRLLSYFEIG